MVVAFLGVIATATHGWHGCAALLLENAIVAIDLADKKQMVGVPTTTRRCWRARRSGPASHRGELSGNFTGRTKPHRTGPTRTAAGGLARGLGSPTATTPSTPPDTATAPPARQQATPTQAQTVIAAAILRHLHAVITTGRAWDPLIATHGTRQQAASPVAA